MRLPDATVHVGPKDWASEVWVADGNHDLVGIRSRAGMTVSAQAGWRLSPRH